MSTPISGPCAAWTPIWSCLPLPTGGEAVTGIAVQAATEVLWSLSGQRYGLCTVTLRPCRRDCFGASWPFTDLWWQFGTWPRPVLFDGAWFNVTCGSCPGTCSCGPLEEAVLPAPVHDIVTVLVDGAPLVTGAYRVDDNRILVRTDGGRWPVCQDLAKSDTEVGTWSVTARYGEDVPILGQIAVGELACEFVRLLLGDADCRLPQPVQQLVRQGVTMTFLDPSMVFADGRIGLYTCDLFLTSTNPHRLAGRAQVYDVDGPGFRRAGT